MVNIVAEMGKNARIALAQSTSITIGQKIQALNLIADLILTNQDKILEANRQDCENASHLSAPMLSRLKLSESNLKSMAQSLRDIAAMPNPLGRILDTKTRPNGLIIEKISVPIGVIGIIYESRPNVTTDAAALCFWSGNAVILRGGSESFNSSKILVDIFRQGLHQCRLPMNLVQFIPNIARESVKQMLHCHEYIDVIVPRGGKNLIKLVQSEATMPVFAHLDGNCHIYVHEDADFSQACAIIVNAKLRRVDVCGACESLLVDSAIAAKFIPKIAEILTAQNCEIRACPESLQYIANALPASEADYSMEYLDKIISLKIVKNIDEAILHINQYGSHHTDAIITNNLDKTDFFFHNIQSAIVIHNASTQFADGGELGKGAEIGIATGRFHARGPIGAEELTIFQYHIRGKGQIRN